jgi:agmatinase
MDASRNMELYSYEVGADISKVGICTMQSMAPDVSSPDKMVDKIREEIGIVLDDGKVPLMLGGEHTITVGALRAFRERNKDLTFIHFDAHADSRDELLGSKLMHGTVVARVRELYADIIQVGVRSIDADSAVRAERQKILFMDDIRRMGIKEVIQNIADRAHGNVYISIDLDVLDPGEMPSVGTPEPDGLRFFELVEILKGIGERKKLVGLDVVELCPIPSLHAPDYLAAKLVYLALGCFLLERDKL